MSLYADESIGAVIMVTVLGAGAAWLAGRAIAHTWRPAPQVIGAALLIAAGARFVHFALFGGELTSVASYGCDLLIFILFGLTAWRATRAAQMVRQYPWLYAPAGPLRWRELGQENSSPR